MNHMGTIRFFAREQGDSGKVWSKENCWVSLSLTEAPLASCAQINTLHCSQQLNLYLLWVKPEFYP